MNNIKDIISFNRTNMENYIDEKDFLDLIESNLHLIHDIILNEPMIFSNPDIKNIIVNIMIIKYWFKRRKRTRGYTI